MENIENINVNMNNSDKIDVNTDKVNVNVKNIMYMSSILSLVLFFIAGWMIADISNNGILGIRSLFKSISFICYGFGVFCGSLLWYLGYNYKTSSYIDVKCKW